MIADQSRPAAFIHLLHRQFPDSTMLRRLKLSQWIFLVMGMTTVLTLFMSALGILSVQSIQRALTSSSSAVQQKLDRQNGLLQKKSDQFQLATRIGEAGSLQELSEIAAHSPEASVDSANSVGDPLLLATAKLLQSRRKYL